MSFSEEFLIFACLAWLFGLSMGVIYLFVRSATKDELDASDQDTADLRESIGTMQTQMARVDERTASIQQQLILIIEKMRSER